MKKNDAGHSGWITALLPFLVGILPLLLLHLETAQLARVSRDNAVQSWLGTARPLGERFSERAKPQFWLEEGLRRVRSGSVSFRTAPEKGAFLSRATEKLRRWGLSDLQVWAASEDLAVSSDPDQFTLLQGTHLRGDFRVFFRGLLKELAIEGSGAAQHISGETWASRLKATFGDGMPMELFTRTWRGQAFFVTFQRRFGLAAWDTLPDRNGKISGAVFFFWPLGPDFARRGVELALQHWHMISPSRRFIPAAIDLPAPGTRRKRRLLLPAAVSSDDRARLEMHALGRRLKAKPAHPDAFVPSGAETPLPVGRIDLHALDIPSTAGSRWLLPLPLPPLSGLAGMIVSPAPVISDSFSGMFARCGLYVYLFIIFICIG
ncbi:MAG TPA: hypothetical protein PKM25_19315, partial [Candidatus Ozemobacteraceae bacterium]|nr:hypothetical protein [Candidatus Ozemobacteraceae bacterium]